MRITHIYHSGFLYEFEDCVWLIDYYRGEIPPIDKTKKVLVFASHSHQDHFNPEIFGYFREFPHVEYVLSRDIPLKPNYLKKYGVDERQEKQISVVRADQEYDLDDGGGGIIQLRTLRSTDQGVAFLLDYQGKRIYHAGDLNWWHWEGEDRQWNNNMAANFKKEMEKLRGVHLDVACVPLDSRLGDAYRWGLDWLLEVAKVDQVYPMHFWDDREVVQRYMRETTKPDTNILG